MYIHVAVHFRSGFSGSEIRWLRRLRREGSPERLSRSYQLAHWNVATHGGEYTLQNRVRETTPNSLSHPIICELLIWRFYHGKKTKRRITELHSCQHGRGWYALETIQKNRLAFPPVCFTSIFQLLASSLRSLLLLSLIPQLVSSLFPASRIFITLAAKMVCALR